MSTENSGRIIEWDPRKGFGFVHDGTHRVFLHERDFVKPHKVPERGDTVTFSFGTDPTGRTCAKNVVVREVRGGIHALHVAVLAALLVGPGFAMHRLAPSVDYRLMLGLAAAVSLLTYGLYWLDKKRAQEGDARVPEKILHSLELAGGWPGAFLAQRAFRHKSAKATYLLVFWLIVSIHQFATIDYALGWRLSREAKALLKRPPSAQPATPSR